MLDVQTGDEGGGISSAMREVECEVCRRKFKGLEQHKYVEERRKPLS